MPEISAFAGFFFLMIVTGVKPKMWLSPYCHVITCSGKKFCADCFVAATRFMRFEFHKSMQCVTCNHPFLLCQQETIPNRTGSGMKLAELQTCSY